MNQSHVRDEERVRGYVDFVYAAAVRQMGKAATNAAVEDVVQGVFLVMGRKAREGALPEERFMWGWLMRVTQYAVKEARRAERRRGFHERRAAEMRSEQEAASEKEHGAVEAALDEALLSLGRMDREVVVRRYLRGEPVQAVAAAVGMEENTAGRRIARALEKLRKALRRRGVVAPAGIVIGVMASEMLLKAPAAMAAGMGATGSTAASGIAKGVLWRLSVAKVSAIGVAAGVIVGIGMGAGIGLKGMAQTPPPNSGAVASVAPTSTPTTLEAAGTQPVADVVALEKAWNDMEQVEPGASRGMLAFVNKPQKAIAFFKGRLLPLTISEAELRELIGKLGSTDEAVWQPTFEKLEYFDPRLAIGLTTLMDEVKDFPARGRLVAVLTDNDAAHLTANRIELMHVSRGYNFQLYGDKGQGPHGYIGADWAEDQVARLTDEKFIKKKKWTQAVRGMLVLEAIGSPEAVAILQAMGTGNVQAEPTKVAKECLEEIAAEREVVTEEVMEGWWADMETSGRHESRATLKFAAHPKEAVGFLKGKLVPLTIERAEVEKLVAALGDDDELVWEPAFEKLGYFDPRLVMGVDDLMKLATTTVQKERVIALLTDSKAERFSGRAVALVRDGPMSFNVSNMQRGSYGQVIEPVAKVDMYGGKPQWQRAVRAELVLGEIGTAEAVEVLKRMASGNAEAGPTRVAKEELERMGK
jgi:RNA polymerase sigma factor (sigma-70 family)